MGHATNLMRVYIQNELYANEPCSDGTRESGECMLLSYCHVLVLDSTAVAVAAVV